MPCESHIGATGTTFIVCSRGRRTLCKFCRTRYVTKLCDAPGAKGKTCDAGMCDACATNVGPETDYCPDHRHQQSLFGGKQ